MSTDEQTMTINSSVSNIIIIYGGFTLMSIHSPIMTINSFVYIIIIRNDGMVPNVCSCWWLSAIVLNVLWKKENKIT